MPATERAVLAQSLSQFNSTCNHYLTEEDFPSFVTHALCGQGEDAEYGQYQVALDPILNRLDENHPISVLRDYDSLIGVSPHIRVNGPLWVYAISKHEDSLQNNIHLSHPIVSLCTRLHFSNH